MNIDLATCTEAELNAAILIRRAAQRQQQGAANNQGAAAPAGNNQGAAAASPNGQRNGNNQRNGHRATGVQDTLADLARKYGEVQEGLNDMRGDMRTLVGEVRGLRNHVDHALALPPSRPAARLGARSPTRNLVECYDPTIGTYWAEGEEPDGDVQEQRVQVYDSRTNRTSWQVSRVRVAARPALPAAPAQDVVVIRKKETSFLDDVGDSLYTGLKYALVAAPLVAGIALAGKGIEALVGAAPVPA